MADRIIWVMVIWTVATASSDDWTSHCNKCKCVWSNGKRTADCTSISLSDIPRDLSSEIREIDFSNNPLHTLGKEVLVKAELRDIHKLKFQNCNISSIDETAFKGLSLLIELDLSRNSISILTKRTFRDNLKLRVLSLSYNNLKRLDEGLFYNMTHLQRITLNDNEIETIHNTTFVLLPSLQHINLDNNRMTVITSDFLNNLPKLNSLNLKGNPWVCDCHLQEFRSRTVKDNLITGPTECAEPPQLRGRLWSDDKVIFACVPQILEPLPSTHIQATTSNVTLTCRVLGDPQPDVDWVTNGRIIDRDPRQNTQRFITSKRKVGDYTWNNLTITNVNYRDKGEYKCVAKNPGGVDEKNVSLIVSVIGGVGSGGSLPLGSALPLIIALSVGAVVVLIVILILICCCCKRNTHGMNTKRRDLIQTSSDECIRLHHGQPEMEKALITDVNPVMKPPRVCSVPPSVNSGGTEVSEVKKNLLDNDSVFGEQKPSSGTNACVFVFIRCLTLPNTPSFTHVPNKQISH
ncbi:I-set and/or LRR 8 domain containing protein [Asbolus verrucosus]|uniref:I-set and/or LRR 8 domain containing protein n=1 Tax=Asbolus verrucosus TaxID=1661398 RepID=A0A482W139_ASBVE|nr:I-set and/or LRR 8 domain containing protein [Asbolus verrucosus]